jgi:hypothetical protein
LILRRVWRWPFVLEDLIAAVDPATAARTPDEVLGFVLRLLADQPPEMSASGNHCLGGSLWMNSGHSLSITMRI